jgi:hypothetical protein
MQGNVGTAYRQRSQLLVFYFIFVAVGCVLLRERSEDRQRGAEAARQAGLDAHAARMRVNSAEWKSMAEEMSRKIGF